MCVTGKIDGIQAIGRQKKQNIRTVHVTLCKHRYFGRPTENTTEASVE